MAHEQVSCIRKNLAYRHYRNGNRRRQSKCPPYVPNEAAHILQFGLDTWRETRQALKSSNLYSFSKIMAICPAALFAIHTAKS